MKVPKQLSSCALWLGISALTIGGAEAAEINLFNAAAFTSIINTLAPDFQKSAGHTFAVTTDVAAVLKRRIDAGEAFDLAILNPPHIDELIKSGKVVGTTRVNVARAGIGVGVRAGAAKPDISTADEFRRTLLNAKTVAYSKEGASGAHFTKMLASLGIAEQMKERLRPQSAGVTAQAVAKGDADIVVVNIAPILAATGVDFVGPVPSEFQVWINFTAGVSATAKQPDAARALAAFLITPAAAKVIKARGMEPIVP